MPLNRRRFLVSEVIQTSQIDCGPASLKALLDGFGVRTSYGRLREACQTDVDGTSIDTLEVVAEQLGLDAQQILLPLDHVLLKEAAALPALAVVRSANGTAHFVVAWRCHGPLVQLMDPARGRLWMTRRSFLDQLVVHSMTVPALAWREWAGSEAFLRPLRRRLRVIGLSSKEARRAIDAALSDPSWRELAAVDAAARMIASLQSSGALARRRGLQTFNALTSRDDGSPTDSIAPQYWSVRSTPADDDAADSLTLRGAVLINVKGKQLNRDTAEETDNGAARTPVLSPEIAAALNEPPIRPLRSLWSALAKDGWLGHTAALVALSIAVVGVVFEAVLLRGTLDIGTLLHAPEQRLGAGLTLVAFATMLLGVEYILAASERRMGGHLEGRLRAMFLDKIPRLADAYFQSRPVADMLERSHTLHTIRTLPRLGLRFLRVSLELFVTALAIAWLSPETALLAIIAAVAAAAIPLWAQSSVAERDLRVRTHTGALSRFHLDALLGRTAIEAHGASRTIEREHDGLLGEWAGSAMALQRASLATEGLQMVVGFGLVAWILLTRFGSTGNSALLLQVYWLLNLPALGYELALIAREYPAYRSTILRLLEPLGATDFQSASSVVEPARPAPIADGVRVRARGVSVRSAGHSILEGIDLDIAPGAHVAVVGASGAGKSTLLGLLLGWQRPADGDLLVDEQSLTAERIDALRQSTAWVDPGVQIWNRSLLENLLYGSGNLQGVGTVLEMCGLLPVVAKLPQGLGTPLGEGGALLSAGEAQRVRLARAMLRKNPRLVILDEPFLGLERDRRRALLANVRQRWEGCTLFYVTHDVSETRNFDLVVVIENGRLIENGEPLHLAQSMSSRYRRMLQTQESVLRRIVSSGDWKRIRLESGRLVGEPLRANEHTA